MTNNKRMDLRINENLKAALQAKAEEESRSVNNLLLKIVKEYLGDDYIERFKHTLEHS